MPKNNLKTPIKQLDQERMKRMELAKRIEGPLPQLNVDTNEKADEYRLTVSSDDRRRLLAALKCT